jgi:Outer membrane protein beta-barrel domain
MKGFFSIFNIQIITMRGLVFILIVFVNTSLNSQTVSNLEEIDSLYREDQFYIGMTYTLLAKKPDGVSQNSFSAGISGGFLRDFPMNKKRTLAIAPGMGFSFTNFKQNIVISEVNKVPTYVLIPSNVNFDKNKLSLFSLDVPFELRWRTSTFETHKFWRIYTGCKFSYVFYNRSKYIGSDAEISVVNNPDINKIQWSVYTSIGYNTWNLYANYSLSNVFNKDVISPNGNLKSLNIGVMFYLL